MNKKSQRIIEKYSSHHWNWNHTLIDPIKVKVCLIIISQWDEMLCEFRCKKNRTEFISTDKR